MHIELYTLCFLLWVNKWNVRLNFHWAHDEWCKLGAQQNLQLNTYCSGKLVQNSFPLLHAVRLWLPLVQIAGDKMPLTEMNVETMPSWGSIYRPIRVKKRVISYMMEDLGGAVRQFHNVSCGDPSCPPCHHPSILLCEPVTNLNCVVWPYAFNTIFSLVYVWVYQPNCSVSGVYSSHNLFIFTWTIHTLYSQ